MPQRGRAHSGGDGPGSIVPSVEIDHDVRVRRYQMNNPSSRWTLTSDAVDLDFGFAYTAAAVRQDHGALSELDHPVAIASAGPAVLMLSLSRGAMDVDPSGLTVTIMNQLLAEADEDASLASETIRRVRTRLWQLFGEGAFRGAVPKGFVLVMSGDGRASISGFGAGGVAAVSDRGVNLLHMDDRFRALQQQGLALEKVLPSYATVDPLVLAVSSLTQLDPQSQETIIHAEVPAEGTIMLMSRAIVPIVLPPSGASLEEWSVAEAGWTHGMSGAVIQVFRRGGEPKWATLPWLRELA